MSLVQANPAACRQPLKCIAERLHELNRERGVDTRRRFCENDFVGANQDLVAGGDPF